MDYTKPFEVKNFDGLDIRWVKVFKDIDPDGDQGILGWVGAQNERTIDDCTINDCDVTATNYVGINPSYEGETESEKIAINNQLIGFKVRIGLSRSGLV